MKLEYIIPPALAAWFLWSCFEIATCSIILSPFNFWQIFKLIDNVIA